VCGTLLYQDFKSRKVNLYAMIILFFVNLYVGFSILEMKVFSLTLMNILLVIFLLLSLFIYYSIKNKKAYNITDKELGKGDVIMLLVLTPSFLSFNMMVFIISSITISILIALIFRLKIIPFAGIIALTFMTTTFLRQLNYIGSYTPFKFENWI
jgi:hypothetical protein